jgi:hypothetical protein
MKGVGFGPRNVRASKARATPSTLPGLELLNPNLVFGTAWFWTLPEIHDVQEDIDALRKEFRRLLDAVAHSS